MALGLSFSNGKPAAMARGKYTTRNNRYVEIRDSHVETGSTGGQEWSKTMWDGVLYAANMRDVESTHSWSDEGGYLHQEGVRNEFDLCTVIEQYAAPEPALTHVNDPALLETQLHYAAILKTLGPHMRENESSFDCVARIAASHKRAVELVAGPGKL